MFILGISLIGGHDLSLSIIDNAGKILFCTEEERYSQKKGSKYEFHPDYILHILREAGISINKISIIAIPEKLENWRSIDYPTLSFNPIERSKHFKLWLDILVKKLNFRGEIIYVGHHLSHAASAYYLSEYSNAVILTVDGFGDGEAVTIYKGQNADLHKLYFNSFPHSIAYLYQSFASMLGLSGVEKAGKLMGLSGYGKPKYKDYIFENFIYYEGDKLRLAPLLASSVAKSQIWGDKLKTCFCNSGIDIVGEKENIAASIQVVFEIEIERLIDLAKRLGREDNLCCSGGAFLNCLNNGKLINYSYFKSYYVSPVASDLGLSLGAALYCNRAAKYQMDTLYLGSDIDDNGLEQKTNKNQFELIKYENKDDLVSAAAEALNNGNVIGWCHGRMEFGHRALGNRSILANPLNPRIKDDLNDLKNREKWRPFGVIVLKEEVTNWFVWKGDAPFMNFAVRAINSINLPAIQHIDSTCRIQTVSESDNKLLYLLLKQFYKATGVPILINTSLNTQNEPIARTTEDCLRFFESAKINKCFIGSYMIQKLPCGKYAKLGASEFSFDSTKAYLVFDPLNEKSTFCNQQSNILHYTGLKGLGHLDYNLSILEIKKVMQGYQKLEVVVPWHVEVIMDMMPQISNFITYIISIEKNIRINVKDIFGKEMDLSKIHLMEIQHTNTDVEIHFLNSLFKNDKEKIATITYDNRIQASSFH